MEHKTLTITLFDTATFWNNDGTRLIASLLKRAGHTVKSVFMPWDIKLPYPEEELYQLDELLKNTDLVMISVYSYYSSRAVEITDFVHRNYPEMKVIWGGPHCISAPEISLQHADGVCFAEGDIAVVELANRMASGQDYTTTPNMAFNIKGTCVKNDVLPPTSDLDSLPYPDYEISDQFMLRNGLYQMTNSNLRTFLSAYPFDIPALWILTARGCPNLCTYCNNHRYFSLHGSNKMRYRSVDHFIGELEFVLNKLDFFEYVGFGDDDFLMRPIQELEYFSKQYKKKIGIPFIIELSANTYRREKLEVLLDAGLKVVEMGVQSGSQRVLDEIYNRPIKAKRTKAVIHDLKDCQQANDLHIILDFILDNPYESRDDIIQTYDYICGLPDSIHINLFNLSFFPGTIIYERALKDGFIKRFSEQTFRPYIISKGSIRYQKNYETFLVLLTQHPWAKRLPLYVLRMLGSRWIRSIASLLPKTFYGFILKKVA